MPPAMRSSAPNGTRSDMPPVFGSLPALFVSEPDEVEVLTSFSDGPAAKATLLKLDGLAAKV